MEYWKILTLELWTNELEREVDRENKEIVHLDGTHKNGLHILAEKNITGVLGFMGLQTTLEKDFLWYITILKV